MVFGKFDRQVQAEDDKRKLIVCFEDEQVAAFQPGIELAKPAAARLYLPAKIAAPHRHDDVPAKTAAGRTGERDAHCRNAFRLQRIYDGAFDASALIAGAAATHVD
jgi:hypothetical protein